MSVSIGGISQNDMPNVISVGWSVLYPDSVSSRNSKTRRIYDEVKRTYSQNVYSSTRLSCKGEDII